ncbi:hypothetical protein K466DRAFT_592228 [Polyporus arcularius HHB13444]|uniref:Uncharacterized protein n=1 Tax=Polyporus arcularius HHB13444 TaxID=1314778 RepID=A0A5C3NR08_9APHY|nr:hypothetical protein K466DRAFT_592228 [Polyporus arcularius HHB13444]
MTSHPAAGRTNTQQPDVLTTRAEPPGAPVSVLDSCQAAACVKLYAGMRDVTW